MLASDGAVELESTSEEMRSGKRLAIGIVVVGVLLVSVQISFVVLSNVVDAAAPAPASATTFTVGHDVSDK